MNTILAMMIAGLGLFFIGLHLVSTNLQQLSSRGFRTLIARFTDRAWLASLLGILAGAIMQSTSAVTVILASMTASGLVTVRRALPIVNWANVGATLLVFVAVLNLRVAILYALGISALAFAFSKGVRWKTASGTGLGIGMLLFGMDRMKESAASLQEFAWFHDLMTQAQGSYATALIAGTLLSFLTQSSTAVTLIALTMAHAGLLGTGEIMMIIYGANVGSSFARMLLASGLRGSSRQIGRFQDFFKIAGTTLFVVLFYVEVYGHVPLVAALAAGLAHDVETQMALVNFVYNLAMAVVLTPLLGPLQELLERLWPASDAEDFARVKYLHPQAVDDSETALDLVEKEQMRLVTRLPQYLDALRCPPGERRKVDLEGMHQAFGLLANEVESYLTALVLRPLPAKTTERLTNVHARHGLVRLVEENVCQLVTAVRQAPPSEALAPLAENFIEALDFMLLTAGDAVTTLGAGEGQMLAGLCADRGAMMGKIRGLYLSAGDGLGPTDKTLLFDLTTLFDRVVWILRKLAQLLEEGRKEQEPRG